MMIRFRPLKPPFSLVCFHSLRSPALRLSWHRHKRRPEMSHLKGTIIRLRLPER